MRKGIRYLTSAVLLTASAHAQADEGMWPLDMIPKERIQKQHNVALGDAWLERVRLATVKFGGGTGSFVSPTGLVLTNHHVGAGCIDKLGRAGKDYLGNGFLAGPDGPEGKCAGVDVQVLLSIEDVTEKVRAARKPGMSDADANVAIKGTIAQLEKSCADKSASRCSVVTLYAGGKYDLYTYKKYSDVRLVFAPEQDMASFGGDPDNFSYPRYGFDMALFRVYENDQPVRPKEYLRMSSTGPKEGETTFVSGHPGTTERLLTTAELRSLRDTVYPYYLDSLLKPTLTKLVAYGKENEESARQIKGTHHGLQNGVKAITGYLRSLKDPVLSKVKADSEAQFRKAIEADPKLKQSYGTVFDDIAVTQKKRTELFKRYIALEGTNIGASLLLRTARWLVRLPAELETPNETRLPEYTDANLDALKHRLFSPAPVYGGMEVLLVRGWLERAVRDLGAQDPTVKAILAGRTVERAAREIVAGSKLFDVYARRKLEAGGKQAIAESTDPAIVAMRTLDPEARAVRKRMDDEVEAPSRKNGERIAQALFAVHGTSIAPDATSTLRLSVGIVKGYTENGKPIPWATNTAGLYAHATGTPPRKLSARWASAKATLDHKSGFNFVSTQDITGGNSGSPMINRDGELVGLIFDGNQSSLSNGFVYGETTQRAVSVHPVVILEALQKVYNADALVKELTTR